MLTFCKYWMMFSLTLILEPLFHFRRWLKGLEALGPLFPRPALKRLSCWLSLWVDKQGFRNHNLASSRWLRVTTCRTICFWTTRRLVLSFLHYVVNSLLAGSTLPSVNFLYQRFVVVQSLSPVQLFATPLTAAHQVSLSFTISRSLFRLMSIEPAMPSNHLILCCHLLLPSVFPSIRVFSNELALLISFGHLIWRSDSLEKATDDLFWLGKEIHVCWNCF